MPDTHVTAAGEEHRWAVIIGSGFGAAVTACRLAQAFATPGGKLDGENVAHSDAPGLPKSHSICILERGRRYGPQDFPRLKLPDYLTSDPRRQTSQRVPDASRLLWGTDQGLFDIRNLGRLQVVQAAGYGGGSLVYASVHLRPPAETSQWLAENYGSLNKEFERAAQWLSVNPLPRDAQNIYPKTVLMRKAAEKLGRVSDGAPGFFYPPLAVRFRSPEPSPDGERTSQGEARPNNPFGREQGVCNGCGNCTLGCQEQAKNTLDLNYLAVAEELGVEVRTLAQALRIERGPHHTEDAPQYRITYFDHLEGQECSLTASNVFLGAGAVGSTQLLLRSRDKLDKPDPSAPEHKYKTGLQHLGKDFFANGDSLAVIFDTQQPAEPSHGPTITSAILHVDAMPAPSATANAPADPAAAREGQDARPWFLLEDGGMAFSLERMLGHFRSPLWFARNRLTVAEPGFDRSVFMARAASLRDQGLSDVTTAVASFARLIGRGEERLEKRPLRPFPTQWIDFLPVPLRSKLQLVRDASEAARAEVKDLDERVLEKLGPSTLFFSRWFVDRTQLLGHIADALSELYPALGHLLRERRGFDLAVSLATRLLLGAPDLSNAFVLLAMGPDQKGTLSSGRRGMRVTWDEEPRIKLFGNQERLMRDVAVALGGELRTNPNWTLGKRPVTVHAQGGCGMGVAGASVTDASGQVHGLNRLYVVDAAAFPNSVGVNPSSTITAVAERKAYDFAKREGAVAAARLDDQLKRWDAKLAPLGHKPLQVVLHDSPKIRSLPIGLRWHERLTGWSVTTPPELTAWASENAQPGESQSTEPAQDAGDLAVHLREALKRVELSGERGEPGTQRVVADLDVEFEDVELFVRSFGRRRSLAQGRLSGTVRLGDDSYQVRTDECPGSLEFLLDDGLEPDLRKCSENDPKGLESGLVGLQYRLALVLDRELSRANPDAPERLILIGRKYFHDDPGQDIWPDLTTLFFTLHQDAEHARPARTGVMRVGLRDFLVHQLAGMDALHLTKPGASDDGRYSVPDEAARAWALMRFTQTCFGGIQGVYQRWF